MENDQAEEVVKLNGNGYSTGCKISFIIVVFCFNVDLSDNYYIKIFFN
jgi:hypothetical protein